MMAALSAKVPGANQMPESSKIMSILNCTDFYVLSKIGKFSVKILDTFRELNTMLK